MDKSPQDGSRPRRVLIIEDDDSMRTFYKSLFRRHEDEFACRFEKSAAAALTHLRDGNIEVVVLDWDLPGISGIELLKGLRACPATKSVAVLVVSGRTGPEDHAQALACGADDYLDKPFDIGVFMAKLRGLPRR